jgi:hypothetical protein
MTNKDMSNKKYNYKWSVINVFIDGFTYLNNTISIIRYDAILFK